MRRALLTLAIVALPLTAAAQFSLTGLGSLVISASPVFPKPGEAVELTLSSSVHDISESVVTWRSGETILASGEGADTITVQAGERGTSITVSASIAGESAEITLTPATVDLLWEADSYTPLFYAGRPLASAGTSVRLLAIPRFAAVGSAEVASERIVFTWKRNGGVLRELSGRGKDSARVPAPYLFGSDTISVEASTVDGTVAGEASVRITAIEPLLTLYQLHPLFGPLYRSALSGTTFIPETEMSFVAEPLFADARSATDAQLRYEWTVNQEPIVADAKLPNVLTIGAAGSDGRALIELALTHAQNLFLSADGSWSVTFTETGGASDPFNPR